MDPVIYFAFYKGYCTKTNFYWLRKTSLADKPIDPRFTKSSFLHDFW